MINSKDQGSEDLRRKRANFLIPVFCLLFAGCTFFQPSSQGLPSKDSIVPGETITVEKNQNVYSIARAHGVSMREVIVLNDLKSPFVIHPGQSLVLPAKDKDMAPTPSAAPVPGIEYKPLEGYTPPIQPSSQSITETPLAPPPSSPAPVTAESAPQTLAPPPPATQPVQTTVSNELQSVPPQKLAEAPAEALAKTEETPVPSVAFMWPVQGQIIASFGPKAQGTNNDGINIAAPKGAPVQAAAGGIVVYAGNEMKGFGNLILIRHEGGWVTAYAHLDRMMVARDTVVAPGDMIGTVGSTGGVSTPQLHFETRHDGKPVDPQTVIKKS